MREQTLSNDLKIVFADWEDDFDIDIEQEDFSGNIAYFSVDISHKILGESTCFTARVDKYNECEMEYGDDSWHPITSRNVFVFMWFTAAKPRDI